MSIPNLDIVLSIAIYCTWLFVIVLSISLFLAKVIAFIDLENTGTCILYIV